MFQMLYHGNLGCKLEFYSIILLLKTKYFDCSYITQYEKKHLIVHLTEVLVSYIYLTSFTQLNFNVCLLSSLVGKGYWDVFDIWHQCMRAMDWFVWKDQLNHVIQVLQRVGSTKGDNPLTLDIFFNIMPVVYDNRNYKMISSRYLARKSFYSMNG